MSHRTPHWHGRALSLGLLASLILFAGGPTPTGTAATSRLDQIHRRLGQTQGQLRLARERGRVLTTELQGLNSRIAAAQRSITDLQGREVRVQAELMRVSRRLFSTRGLLRDAQARLARLRLRLVRSRRILSRRLVQLYERGRPDLISVALDAHGFADLLESEQLIGAVGAQDRRIITAVVHGKRETTGLVERLGRLERVQQQAAAAVTARRLALTRIETRLAERRAFFRGVASSRERALARVKNTQGHALDSIGSLRREEASIQQRLSAAAARAASAPAVTASYGPPAPSSGRWVWPVTGTITSPFCERRSYEACHPGMDIAAPEGTPIRAADSGRVIIAGWDGGYGQYTCIQHSASLSSCYGHQSALLVSVGQTVQRGQVIGRVGSTGHSTGPHLHFEARVNGSVVNPLNYL